MLRTCGCDAAVLEALDAYIGRSTIQDCFGTTIPCFCVVATSTSVVGYNVFLLSPELFGIEFEDCCRLPGWWVSWSAGRTKSTVSSAVLATCLDSGLVQDHPLQECRDVAPSFFADAEAL